MLAIAAAKLGFGPVHALDNDPAAVEAARENARSNDVVLETRLADALDDPLPKADVAVANVSLSVVHALGLRVAARHLVTSGYLASDETALDGFEHRERLTDQGWAADLHEK